MQVDRAETAATCHVLCVRLTAAGACQGVTGEAVTGEVCEAFRADVDDWHNHAHVSRSLIGVARRFKLPGLAAVLTDDSQESPPIPPPVTSLFEPVELDERNLTLASLVAEVDPSYGEPGAEDPPKASSRFGKWLIATALFLFAGLSFVAEGPDIETWPQFLYSFALGLVVTGGVIVLYWMRSGRWFVYPGGVLIRRVCFGLRGSELTRYSPRDSVLLVMRTLGSFGAEVHRGYQHIQRSLSEREYVALLAAWQSTARPPTLDETTADPQP